MSIRIGASFGPLYVSTRVGPRRRRRSSAPGLIAACVMLAIWMLQAAVWLLVAAGAVLWWLAQGVAQLIAQQRQSAAKEQVPRAAAATARPSAAEIPPISAGWYADPDHADGLRYFDGHIWTDHLAVRDEPEALAPEDEGLVTRDAVLPLLDPDVAADITRP